MSKLEKDELKAAVHTILTKGKKRKFLESVDIQVKLKSFDLKKNKRFAGNVRLPHPVKSTFKVCVFANAKDEDRAKAAGVDHMTVAQIKALKKDKKKVKKLASQYSAFLASKTLIRKIPRLIGPSLSRSGKFPSVLDPKEDLKKKIDEMSRTIKWQVKKEVNLGTAIGNLNCTEEEIIANLTLALNFLASLCPKKWQNFENIVLKTSMGKPISLL